MKKFIAHLCILMLLVSCKGKITNIKIIATENDKNYKGYLLNYRDRPRVNVTYECPWIKDPENTVFIYMPISFKLENNTGNNLRISKLWDNFNSDTYRPIIIDNNYYDYADNASVSSRNNADITLFVHLPVHKNLLDKEHYNRYFLEKENGKLDSIVIDLINPKLQKEIDVLLKKKQIFISYNEDKNIKENALAYYCVDKQKLGVFRSDSLAKLKTTFRYNCN